MGERDAFGREKDEDSLREMGWRLSRPPAVTPGDPLAAPDVPAAEPVAPEPATPAEPAAPEPATTLLPAAEAPAPAPAAKPPRPAAPSFARRRRRAGPSLARLLILAAILGVGFVVVSRAIDAGRDAVERIGGGPAAAGSLLRPAALRAALARLPRGRLVQPLRVARDRIDAVVISGTTRHIVQIRAGGGIVDVKAPAGRRQAALPRIAAGAPERIARVASRRAGRRAADVDHLVLTRAGWLLFFKDGGPRYRATPAGRRIARVP
jgi:hypothetical protein